MRHSLDFRWNGFSNLLPGLSLTGVLFVSSTGYSQSPESYIVARKIYDRIAGVPPTKATLDSMAQLIERGAVKEAAVLATAAPQFYNINLKHWFGSWTNKEQNSDVPLNDMTATLIGLVKDSENFGLALYGDSIYTGTASTTIPAYSSLNNDHYAALENTRVDLSRALVKQSAATLTGLGESAGIVATRAFGEAYFSAGTNRRALRFVFANFLCRDIEQLHDTTIPDFRIRQDVERSPGGDSLVFRNKCAGCHAGMDGLAGAFAYYDFKDGKTVYTPNVVQSKYFNNKENFLDGFKTQTDEWVNLWVRGTNASIGWSGPENGQGAKSLGELVADSDGFPTCMSKRVYQKVCLSAIDEKKNSSLLEELKTSFVSSGYNLKDLFAETASRCLVD